MSFEQWKKQRLLKKAQKRLKKNLIAEGHDPVAAKKMATGVIKSLQLKEAKVREQQDEVLQP